MKSSVHSKNRNVSQVLWYPIAQIICFLPGIIADFWYMFIAKEERYHFGPAIIVNSLHRSWGFLNMMAYYFIRPGKKNNESDLMENNRSINQISLTMNSDL